MLEGDRTLLRAALAGNKGSVPHGELAGCPSPVTETLRHENYPHPIGSSGDRHHRY